MSLLPGVGALHSLKKRLPPGQAHWESALRPAPSSTLGRCPLLRLSWVSAGRWSRQQPGLPPCWAWVQHCAHSSVAGAADTIQGASAGIPQVHPEEHGGCLRRFRTQVSGCLLSSFSKSARKGLRVQGGPRQMWTWAQGLAGWRQEGHHINCHKLVIIAGKVIQRRGRLLRSPISAAQKVPWRNQA